MSSRMWTTAFLAAATCAWFSVAPDASAAQRSKPPKGASNATAAKAKPSAQADEVPLGDPAGARIDAVNAAIDNPMKGDPETVARGKALFRTMNCAGCHGYDAKGGMGPDLTDTYWLYGGTPVFIFKSIYEGRPQGMPAWKTMLPENSIWDVTSYIESLGGSFPADQYRQALEGELAKGNVRQPEKGGGSRDTAGRH